MTGKNGVSIIICCHNSAPRLKQTLLHISRQKINPLINCELIVVDNASNDNTATAAVNEWTFLNAGNIEFKVIDEPLAGLSNARKKGVQEAKYEYLIFCDDDNWLCDDYVAVVYNFFETNKKVVIIGGFGEPVFENEAVVPIWFDKFSASYALGPQAQQSGTDMTVVYGAGMSVRKSFLALEIYQRSPFFLTGRKAGRLTAGDDSEICFKAKLLGYSIAYLSDLKFKHYITNNRLNWPYLKKLHEGFAQSFVAVNLYKRALDGGDFKLPLFYWFKNMLYYFAIYLKYWPKHFKAYSNVEGTVEEIHHITWKTIALSYFEYNFKTVEMYRQIITLKNTSNR